MLSYICNSHSVDYEEFRFWKILLKIDQLFGVTNRFHLKGRGVKQETSRNRQQAEKAGLPDYFMRYVPPKHQMTFTVLQGIISQKIELYVMYLIQIIV